MDPPLPDDVSFDVLQLHSQTIIDGYHQDLEPVILPANKPPFAKDLESIFEAEKIPKDRPGPTVPGGYPEKLFPPKPERIGIVGGGVSGLLTAMRLGRYFKVDLYEASGSLGGRLYTHKFDNGGEWDYFDVGAMRFPNTKIMSPTFNLFRELGITRESGMLLDYLRASPDSWLYYNGIRVKRANATSEDFGARVSRGGNVPDVWVDKGMANLMKNVYGRFLDKLKADFRDGYAYLMQYDRHSTRSFMSEETLPAEGEYPAKERYPTSVINWLETRNFAPGWFDRALSETILELLAFDDGSGDVKWHCVKGGSSSIINAMKEKLKTDPTLNQNVTIHLNRRVVRVDYRQAAGLIDLHWSASSENGQDGLKDFTQVVLTVSPQVMRLMDLTTCQMDYSQRSAVLLLQPGPSIKVGMRFKSNWWKGQGIAGGQSSTDRPVRNVVYPSYGDGESTTIIASYCWTQDAVNLGCWMRGNDSFAKSQLRDLILADLAAIHGIGIEEIKAEYEEMYAFDWTNNPRTLGAYALFGPGQFGTLLRNLSRPAARGNLHFAGEAISTCHGWVAGSVDSANRAVFQVYITMILRWLEWLRSRKLPGPFPPLERTPPTVLNGPIDLSGEYGPHGEEFEGLYTLFSRDEAIKQLEISKALQDAEFGEI